MRKKVKINEKDSSFQGSSLSRFLCFQPHEGLLNGLLLLTMTLFFLFLRNVCHLRNDWFVLPTASVCRLKGYGLMHVKHHSLTCIALLYN